MVCMGDLWKDLNMMIRYHYVMVNEIEHNMTYLGKTALPEMDPFEERLRFTQYFGLLEELNKRKTTGLNDEKTKDLELQTRELKEYLIRTNIKLAVYFAKTYSRKNPELLEDFSAMGIERLVAKIDTFDLSQNNRFSTYISPWIKQPTRRHLSENRKGIVRTPAYLNKVARRLNEGTLEEEDKKHLKKLPFIETARKPTASYDTLFAHTAAKTSPSRRIELEELPTYTQNLISERLDERQRDIIERRFGLGGAEEKTLKEIGEEIGLTRERVRQIEIEALKRLRMDDDEWKEQKYHILGKKRKRRKASQEETDIQDLPEDEQVAQDQPPEEPADLERWVA